MALSAASGKKQEKASPDGGSKIGWLVNRIKRLRSA
jgi:hypothetical protein